MGIECQCGMSAASHQSVVDQSGNLARFQGRYQTEFHPPARQACLGQPGIHLQTTARERRVACIMTIFVELISLISNSAYVQYSPTKEAL